MARRPNRLPRYDIGTEGVGDVIRLEDNEYIYFGDDDDSGIYYNGTNLIIDPDLVGSGKVILAGDARVLEPKKLYFGNDECQIYWDGVEFFIDSTPAATGGSINMYAEGGMTLNPRGGHCVVKLKDAAGAGQFKVTDSANATQLLVTSDGDVQSTGDIWVGGSQKKLYFSEGVNYLTFNAPALSANTNFVLPSGDGSANQVLKTDGSAALGWADNPSPTKEVWYGIPEATTAAIGDYAGYSRSLNDLVSITGRFPHDFSSITEMSVVFVPAQTSYRLSWTTDYAAAGEAYNTHSESGAIGPVVCTTNAITECDISGEFDSPSASDYFGVTVTVVGNETHVFLGVRLKYA